MTETDLLKRFHQQLDQLNTAQRQAVEAIEGPVMVLAGPGTGKTQVLALRVAQILLETDTAPENILALTFTESAAKNMRARLARLIGSDAYYVQIETFHSFCSGVITTHPEYFALPRDSQPLSDFERFKLLESLITSHELSALKPRREPLYYLKDILKALSDLKREGVSVQAFRAILEAERAQFLETKAELTRSALIKQEKALAKQEELAELYSAYQEKLYALAKFDYDDMVSLVLTAFESHEELLLEYQENILYFLVDEYQDTNTAQNALVDILASYNPATANVFVVGDPNQAIYRFQGASLENVLGFIRRYPQAQVITLTTGYRCSQAIYDAAAAIIAAGESQDVLPQQSDKAGFLGQVSQAAQLQSVSGVSEPLEVYQAPNQVAESIFVLEQITQLHAKGVGFDQMAVLFRTNAESAALIDACKKWGVPHQFDGATSVLDAEPIVQLVTLFRVIDQLKTGQESPELYRLFQLEWFGVSPLLAMQLSRAAHSAKLSMVDVLSRGYETFSKHHAGAPVSEAVFATAVTALNKLIEWGTLDSRVVFSDWSQTVQKESGFLEWVLRQENRIEILGWIAALDREVTALLRANQDMRLAEFLLALETMEEHQLPLTVDQGYSKQHAVTLSTVHKAKGREWAVVFVTGLVDGAWGNTHKRVLLPLPDGILKNTPTNAKESKKQQNEDDRRLFFVALSRAKQQVFLSYPAATVRDGRTREHLPSLFLTEIQPHLEPATLATALDTQEAQAKHLERLVTPPPKQQVALGEKEYLQFLAQHMTLSVSALNAYLRNPEEFLTHYLLKVPTPSTPAFAFGTAVHAALEQLYAGVTPDGHFPALSVLEEKFETTLKKELLLKQDIKRELEHGRLVLAEFYKSQNPGDLANVLATEKFFGFGRSVAHLGDIALTGRIDRIDWIDKTNKTVRLIDYKTGNTRSVGEIEATTKTALQQLSAREQALPEAIRGPYKRQLLFYKLLTELDRSFEPTATEGVFEFVEPDKRSGVRVARAFVLEDEAVSLLKELIITVMAEIRTGEF